MMNVTISINGNILYSRSVRNTGSKTKDGRTLYNCDTGENILHNDKEGAIVLAKKMLDTISEIDKIG